MTFSHLTSRRSVLVAGTTVASSGVRPRRAAAATKITFLTSWFAQAEHGGFYQAQATGLPGHWHDSAVKTER